MPKIIENVRESAVAEARAILESEGYDRLAMRDIAAKCGVAVGTMYNYFESKESLTGSVILEDWQNCYKAMQETVSSAADVRDGLRQIYSLMGDFARAHQYLDSVNPRKAQKLHSYQTRHFVLLEQMNDLLEALFARFRLSVDQEIRNVTAELILNLSEKRYDYRLVEPALSRLLRP